MQKWLCKFVTSLLQYSALANIFWMFVEGLFLHNRIVVSVFNTKAPFKLFYFIGWGKYYCWFCMERNKKILIFFFFVAEFIYNVDFIHFLYFCFYHLWTNILAVNIFLLIPYEFKIGNYIKYYQIICKLHMSYFSILILILTKYKYI